MYIPYELFVIILLLAHLSTGRNILSIDCLLFALGLQGSVVGVRGGGHTWFITALLICYLITPPLAALTDKIKNLKPIVLSLCILPILLALFPLTWIRVLFSPVCTYSIAFIVGQTCEKIVVKKKIEVLAGIMIMFSFLVRILARFICDGSVLYDGIIAPYTQNIAAFALFYIVAAFTKNRNPSKAIRYISSISFEVYLYHYMFCVGPIRIFGLSESWVVNCVIALVATLIIAAIMNSLSKIITERIK